MKILGLQKTTLADYPGKVACTLFLFGCNFRCGFCHNPGLVIKPDRIGYSKEEILNFLKKRRDVLDAVCITGGEPLLTLEKEFLTQIKDLGYLIKLDTNGSYPNKLQEFIKEGLIDYIAMDIKSDKENYSKTAGTNVNIEDIENSIKIISNTKDYEFRTTILYKFHNAFNLREIGRWLNNICEKKPRKYYLQGFKSQEELIDPSFINEKDVSDKDLNELKECVKEYFEETEIR